MTVNFTVDDMRQVIKEEVQRILTINTNGDELLTRKETAHRLKIKENTLAVWAMEGRGPAPTKLGARCLYRRSIILKYIEDNTLPR